jgi:hypothetical protein
MDDPKDEPTNEVDQYFDDSIIELLYEIDGITGELARADQLCLTNLKALIWYVLVDYIGEEVRISKQQETVIFDGERFTEDIMNHFELQYPEMDESVIIEKMSSGFLKYLENNDPIDMWENKLHLIKRENKLIAVDTEEQLEESTKDESTKGELDFD